jgi:hypothetical protein
MSLKNACPWKEGRSRESRVKRITNMLQPVTTRYELIVLAALDRLAQLDGLTVNEIALRCFVTGRVPIFPAFSRSVVNAFNELEQAQTRGTPAWAVQDALEGRR